MWRSFATPATVSSRAFQRELAFRAVGVDVEAQACGGVVDAIEEGDMILAEALVRSHVDALRRKMPEPEAAILGCTHYPLMEDGVQDRRWDPGVAVYSQANIVAESLADYLERHPGMGAGQIPMFLTTGDSERVSDRATQFMRRKIEFTRPDGAAAPLIAGGSGFCLTRTARQPGGTQDMAMKIAILGASGYTGAELVRLISTHPAARSRRSARTRGPARDGQVFPHLRHLDLPAW